jgi:DNA repair protein RecO (recombination protein O)
MLSNTRGIVFQKIKYAESAVIVKIYTEQFGLLSFIVRGLNSKRSFVKKAHFQGLSLLDLDIIYKENKSLHHIKEIKVLHAYQDVIAKPVKQSILFFLNEVLIKTLREETPDKILFKWLYNALIWFDLTEKKVINFHLVFLVQFSKFLGFYPKFSDQNKIYYFDMQEGVFQLNQPDHPNFIKGDFIKKMAAIGKSTFENSDTINISNSDRGKILDALIQYYQLHMPNMHKIHSVDILHSILK